MDETNRKRSKAVRIVAFFKQKWHIFILFFIWLYSAIVQYVWLTLDKAPPWGDGLSFILRGMWLFNQQSMGGWGEFFKSLFHFDAMYPSPPVIALTYFLYYKIFGLFSEMEVMVNSLYLALGIIGIYGIGKHFFNKYIGLFSALIFISLPGILAYGNLGFKEFHIMCFLALAVYFLLKANDFKNRIFSILFAISLAVMLLIKIESIVFIIFPLTVVVVKIFFNRKFFVSRYQVINAILALVFTFCIFSPWYIVNFSSFINFLSARIGAVANINSIYFSTKSLCYYEYSLYDNLLTKFQIFFFIFISIYILARGLYPKVKTIKVKRAVFIWFCFGVSFLIFAFLCEKDTSHILSLLVFISLIIASGCYIIRNKVVKIIFICLISLHAINTPLMLLSAEGSDMEIIPCRVWLSPVDSILYEMRGGRIRNLYGYENRFTKRPWGCRLKAILEFIKEDFGMDNCRNTKPNVFFLANYEHFRFFQMEYYNKKMHSPVSLGFFNVELECIEENIFGDKNHYIVAEDPMLSMYPNKEESRQMKKVFEFISENQERFHRKYKIVKKIELPEGLTANIYKRLSRNP